MPVERVLDTILMGSASPPDKNFAASTFITVSLVIGAAVSLSLQPIKKVAMNSSKTICKSLFYG